MHGSLEVCSLLVFDIFYAIQRVEGPSMSDSKTISVDHGSKVLER